MKKILFLFLLLPYITVFAQKGNVNLIPQPVDLKVMDGYFNLVKTHSITYNKSEARKVAEYLTSKVNPATHFDFRPQLAKTGDVQQIGRAHV